MPCLLSLFAAPAMIALSAVSIPASAYETDAISRMASSKVAIDQLVGNTMVSRLVEDSELEDSQEGKLYLRPDGTGIWVNVESGALPGEIAWSRNDQQQLCIIGAMSDDAQCAWMAISGQQIVISLDHSSSEDELIIRLEKGNPFNL